MKNKPTIKMLKSVVVCCCLIASLCTFFSLAEEDGQVPTTIIVDKDDAIANNNNKTLNNVTNTIDDKLNDEQSKSNALSLSTSMTNVADVSTTVENLTIGSLATSTNSSLNNDDKKSDIIVTEQTKLTEVTSASTTASTTTTTVSTTTTTELTAPPSASSTTTSVAPQTTAQPTPQPSPPPEPRVEDINKNVTLVDKGAVEQEHNSSMSIFFVLMVIMIGTLLIHIMLQLPSKFQYLPDSIVVVILGALIGLILKNIGSTSWEREEVFSPTGFFLVLLPPIIFESGYNLHKGNFFQNIGSILVFAILGTTISALVIGCGVYILGLMGFTYGLNFVESFAFGSLISAVDPVATVAIFHALDVDPVLNMLVFGESILNDAISIVLTTTVMPPGMSSHPSLVNSGTGTAIVNALQRFCMMFFASAGIGVFFAIMSALLLKHIDFRKHPSLEFGLMLVFTYAPYVLAEGIHLSGIMAILFCGIGMSHYTHYNLSTVTQITMQQTMRTLAFIAETCVFAYLGLAIFSFQHQVEPALVVWSIILCLIGRACNIFPLAVLVNKFREHKITHKMQFIMWFSGLRGAISYALSLHLQFSSIETRRVMITTTLIIVLVTTLLFGGSTMPLLRFLSAGKKKRHSNSRKTPRRRREKTITLSKTHEWGQAIDSEYLSEITEEDEIGFTQAKLSGFAWLDRKYFIPFFTRRFTHKELHDCKSQMADLTDKWYQAIRVNDCSEDSESDTEQPSTSSSRINIAKA